MNVHYYTLFTAVIIGSGLWLELDLVSGWLVVINTYLHYYFRFSLPHCQYFGVYKTCAAVKRDFIPK